jgi:hypothetical protein
MGKAIVTLFYMHGCMHCDLFAPEWAKLENMIKKEKVEYKNYVFSTTSYEAGELGMLDNKEKSINGEEVSGFPTVRISLVSDSIGGSSHKNKKHKKKSYMEFMYEGKRQANEIIAVTKSLIDKYSD